MIVNISWIFPNNFNCILNYSHKGIFIFVISYGSTFDFWIHILQSETIELISFIKTIPTFLHFYVHQITKGTHGWCS